MELVSPAEYNDHYGLLQRGRGIPVFKGSPYQRGHGFGGILSSLFRLAIPAGRAAIATGIKSIPKIAKVGGKALAEKAVRAAVPAIRKSAPKLVKHAMSAGLQSGLKFAADKISEKENMGRQRKRKGNITERGVKTKKKKKTNKKTHKTSPSSSQKKTAKRHASRSKTKFDDIFD